MQDEGDLESAVSPHPAELVPPEPQPGNWLAQDETVTTIGFPALFRRSAALSFLVFLPGLVVGIVDLAWYGGGLRNSPWLVVDVIFLVLAFRILRGGVTVDGGDVVVRNVFSTNTLPLSAVTGVEPLTESAARKQHGNGRRVYLIYGERRMRVDALQAQEPYVRADNANRLWRLLHP